MNKKPCLDANGGFDFTPYANKSRFVSGNAFEGYIMSIWNANVFVIFGSWMSYLFKTLFVPICRLFGGWNSIHYGKTVRDMFACMFLFVGKFIYHTSIITWWTIRHIVWPLTKVALMIAGAILVHDAIRNAGKGGNVIDTVNGYRSVI